MSAQNKRPFPTVMLCLCALFAALMAVGAWISIPMVSGISITLQLLAIMTCAALLEPLYALLSVTVYVLLGLCGLPVFSNFGSGIGVLGGPTGGYIIGFLPAVLFTSMLIHCNGSGDVHLYLRFAWKKKTLLELDLMPAFYMAIGVAVCYTVGSLWFMKSRSVDLQKTLAVCVLPYIPFDLIKIGLSIIISQAVAMPLKQVIRRSTTR